MATIEELLQRGEIVHLKIRPHGVVFLRPALWLAIAAACFVIAPLSDHLRLWAVAGGLLAGAALVAAIESALRRAGTELAVTDRRLLLRTGRLDETICEAFGPAIAGLEIGQDALSRRLGYAWFRIPGLGREMPRLPFGQPDLLRARIEALALNFRVVPAPDVVPPAPEKAPEAAASVRRPMSREPVVRLAALNEGIEPAPRPKTNGDARPKLNGDGRIGLRTQPEFDRI